ENQQNYRSLEEKNRFLQDAYLGKMRQLLQPGPDFDAALPAVLVAHMHVQGAVLSNLLPLPDDQALCLATGDLPTELAYVALGHVHRPQCLGGLSHVRYSGSLDRLDLGERND